MKTPPPAAPAAGLPTWPPSAPPSSRPSKTPATCTFPKADATTPPQPKPSASTASIRTDADNHGTRRSPGSWARRDNFGRREEVECAPADPAGGEALPGKVVEQEMLVTGVGAEHDALHPALAALAGCRAVLHA